MNAHMFLLMNIFGFKCQMLQKNLWYTFAVEFFFAVLKCEFRLNFIQTVCKFSTSDTTDECVMVLFSYRTVIDGGILVCISHYDNEMSDF